MAAKLATESLNTLKLPEVKPAKQSRSRKSRMTL